MTPRLFLPAVLTAPLLWAAFFPLDLGPLAFVALVPWLTLVRAPAVGGRWRRYLAAYGGGLAFFLPALQWIRVAHPMMYLSWLGLALACPVFWCVGLFLLRRIDRLRVVPLAVSVPAVWVGLEYVRAHFPTGFPALQHVGLYQMVGFGWYFLGYTQHAALPLIQAADVGGVYAVSAVVAAANGAACDWLTRVTAVRRALRWDGGAGPVWRPVAGTAFAGGLAAAAVVYGYGALDHAPFADGPRVAAIQGTIPQFEKNKRGITLVDAYKGVFDAALRQTPAPDLVVWPETCFPADWYEPVAAADRSAVPATYLDGRARTEQEFPGYRIPANLLLGLNRVEWDGTTAWKFNSALLLNRDGRAAGSYDKMHLVPFGEYVPFRETVPLMRKLTPYGDREYSCRPGDRWTRFALLAGPRQFTFGCLICYEDSDPYLARQYARPADPVNFLVNISNDGWFDGTEEHEQHLAICRFRAVEARRSIVRAVNMGISGVIDPDGRVVALPAATWAASVKAEGVVAANVPLDTRPSFYARVGDWVPAVAWAFVAVCAALALVRRPV